VTRPPSVQRAAAPPAVETAGATSPLVAVPRDSLERAARLIEAALGCPTTVHDAARSDCETVAPASAAGEPLRLLHVCLAASPAAREEVYACGDPGRDRAAPDLPAARDLGARAYAILPLEDAATSEPLTALYVLSQSPREWSDDAVRALRHVAASLAAEVQLRRELARHELVEEDLRQHALRDRLTGLPNRTVFVDRLAHALERARRHKRFRFAVLSIDLDRFKAVNDSLGHEAGDAVLVAVARRLESCVRGEDMVARLSGDEFAILLESISDDSDGPRVAERIRRSLAAPIPTAESEVFTSASMGIVLGSSDGADTPSGLLQRAGIATTRAKASGRDRYEMFDRAMHARALARLRTEMELRRAVERGEFELYYQPLVTLETGRITELEALVRWQHPERGIVQPLEFIPLAEETGLIVALGAWVLDAACRQMCEWQRRFPRPDGDAPLALSVNISLRQFLEPGFAGHVAETLRASRLDAQSLKLEITESFAVDDPDRTRRTLEELRALGVRIYLDDFGTGYSSLGHVHQLPLDAVKIDRAFVTRMDQSVMHLQLVHTVRALARNIGVLAVAEGVETEAQLRTLRALGCESAQGYLFSRPVPAGDIERLLAEDPRW
jgi:diguanylate cyclase (GGDEF)-like protein